MSDKFKKLYIRRYSSQQSDRDGLSRQGIWKFPGGSFAGPFGSVILLNKDSFQFRFYM